MVCPFTQISHPYAMPPTRLVSKQPTTVPTMGLAISNMDLGMRAPIATVTLADANLPW